MKTTTFFIRVAIALACLFLNSCRKESIPIPADASDVEEVVSWVKENRSKLVSSTPQDSNQLKPELSLINKFNPQAISWAENCLVLEKIVKTGNSVKTLIFMISDEPGAAKKVCDRLSKEANENNYKFESAKINDSAIYAILHVIDLN